VFELARLMGTSVQMIEPYASAITSTGRADRCGGRGQNINRRPAADLAGQAEHEQATLPGLSSV
jgi:hypothetical protein